MAERAHPYHEGFKDRWCGLKRNPYRRKLYERYRFCNGYIAGKAVLDVPCGTGWGTSLLGGYRFALGVDISEDAVAFASEHYQRRGDLRFCVGDMASLPVDDDAVDVLICLEGFEHVAREIGAAFVRETKRVVRRGGLLIMTCPILDDRGKDSGNPHHVYEYPERELIEIFNEGFRILSLERLEGPDGPGYRSVLANLKDARYTDG